MKQAAALGGRHHGDGVGRAGGAEVGPFERIDGDVNLVEGPPAFRLLRQPDFLTDIQHRRLVSLAFADDDGAVDGDGVHLAPHRLDRHLVGQMPIALAHGVRTGDGRLLDHAQELEREIGFH